MLELITQTHNLPFSVALAIVLVLAVLQFVGLGDLIGADMDIDVDADGGIAIDAGLLSLAGLGRVPFLMWLMILLSLFGVIGLACQQILSSFAGMPWPAWLIVPATGAVALVGTGAITRLLERILPRDETTAIDISSLIGREAEVVIGKATPGNPARARVIDHFGQAHHVMLEPANAGQSFVEHERVLLVHHEGDLFKAITRGDHYLPRID